MFLHIWRVLSWDPSWTHFGTQNLSKIDPKMRPKMGPRWVPRENTPNMQKHWKTVGFSMILVSPGGPKWAKNRSQDGFKMRCQLDGQKWLKMLPRWVQLGAKLGLKNRLSCFKTPKWGLERVLKKSIRNNVQKESKQKTCLSMGTGSAFKLKECLSMYVTSIIDQ